MSHVKVSRLRRFFGLAESARPDCRPAWVESMEPRLLMADAAPTVFVVAANLQQAVSTQRVVVEFRDDASVTEAGLDVSKIWITSPGGTFLNFVVAYVVQTAPAVVRVGLDVSGPGGGWDLADNGTYNVTVSPGACVDSGGNANVEGAGSFTFQLPDDGTSPVVTWLSAASLPLPGQPPVTGAAGGTISLLYSDRTGVDAESIDATDLLITAPDGRALAVTGVSLSRTGDGTPITATYSVAAPGGAWDLADNGNYTVKLLAGAVADAAGNAVAEQTVQTLSIRVPDVTPPTATLHALAPVASADGTYSVTVTYQDDVGLSAAGFGAGNVIITGPGGQALSAGAVRVAEQGDGTPRTVTYEFAAPGGSWDWSDNGTYTVTVRAGAPGAAVDSSSNPIAVAVSGSFDVDLAPRSLGTFGGRTALKFTDPDGTKVTLTAKAGGGEAFLAGDQVWLSLADGTALTVGARGGNKRVVFGDVRIAGSLAALTAKGADLVGTLSATGNLGKVTLGTISGTVAAVGQVASLSAASLSGARVLSGVDLGADRRLGGAGADADVYGAGSILALKVAGSITGALVAAGLRPVDATYGSEAGEVLGGAESRILSVTARSCDPSTRFAAGSFGRAKLGKAVAPAADGRFVTPGLKSL